MKKAKTLVKQINELYLELMGNYTHREICEAIKETPDTDWFLEDLYNYCDDEEAAIYNRISEDIIPVVKAREYYENDLIQHGGFFKNEIKNCSDSDFVEMLNEMDMYGCGTCFYLVREDISPSELHKIVYG